MLNDYYAKASRLKKFLIKCGIIYGAILLTLYVYFRASYINLTPVFGVFAVILFLAELHMFIHLYGFFYSLWPRKYPVYEIAHTDPNTQINMWITVCGEPVEVLRDTIRHAQAAIAVYKTQVHPVKEPRVIVLNDGRVANKDNWQEVENLCKELGADCVTRTVPGGFKAGNINNGLKVYSADDADTTVDCFFDADFCAKPEFITQILKPLVDPAVDFVQSPQRYKSYATWVAKAASAHQIFFFDYVCPAKSYDNALFLCGTNYAIRRSALMAVGGMDTNYITEDYATSINLHLAGKRGVFMPKVLALGLAPMTLKEYFVQQTRWSKGNFDTTSGMFKKLFFGPLTLRQKFHYFLSATYYFIGVRDLLFLLAPLPFLFFGISVVRSNSSIYLLAVYLPLLISTVLLHAFLMRNPVKSIALNLIAFPTLTVALASSILKKNLAFIVTIKKYERENPFRVYRIQLAVAILIAAGLVYSLFIGGRQGLGGAVNYFWATFDATFLFLGFFLVVKENITPSAGEE